MLRRTLTALLIVLLAVPELPAHSVHDWENAKKLKRGSSVEVLLQSGENIRGEVEDVSDAGMQIATEGGNIEPRVGWLRDVDRASVRRIVRIRQTKFPDSRRWMITGAVAGGAIGLTAGAVGDIEHGNNGRWILGGLGGAGLGFLVSCAALAAVATVHIAQTPRRRDVVYEDTTSIYPPRS
ncbi:MAG: hypothetical protein ABSB66_01205 [Candidatus Acidiferrales bacterium]|jgi:hypothetical protein